jgi:hypothetical protein
MPNNPWATEKEEENLEQFFILDHQSLHSSHISLNFARKFIL